MSIKHFKPLTLGYKKTGGAYVEKEGQIYDLVEKKKALQVNKVK